MTTPNPTPPSAEAMVNLLKAVSAALAKQQSVMRDAYGCDAHEIEILDVLKEHFAPLREKITGLQGLNIQNEEIISTLTDDRDALRKRVAALEAALASEAFNSNLAIFEHKSRITALQATVQASEGDKRRYMERIRTHDEGPLDHACSVCVKNAGADDSMVIPGFVCTYHEVQAIHDAARATHSEGKAFSSNPHDHGMKPSGTVGPFATWSPPDVGGTKEGRA